MNYEINIETLAVIPINEQKTKILEIDRELIINYNFLDIINNSCKYFGSSLKGRIEGSKSIIGNNYKLPIIIEEINKIIFIPLASSKSNKCIWLSLNNILNHQKYNNHSSLITFINNKSIEIPISYGSLYNQILRATRLQFLLTKRQEKY